MQNLHALAVRPVLEAKLDEIHVCRDSLSRETTVEHVLTRVRSSGAMATSAPSIMVGRSCTTKLGFGNCRARWIESVRRYPPTSTTVLRSNWPQEYASTM